MPRISKSMSMIMALCLCLAMLAPVFVVAPAADAASTYSVLKTESVSSTGTYLSDPIIQVNVGNTAALSNGDQVSIDLPSGLELDDSDNDTAAYTSIPVGYEVNGTTYLPNGGALAATDVCSVVINIPQTVDGGGANAFYNATPTTPAIEVSSTGNTITLTANAANLNAANTEGQIYIQFENVRVSDTFDGDIKVDVTAPDNSGFTSALGVTIGKYISGAKGTTTVVAGTKSMSTDATTMENITVQETVKDALKQGEVITFDLPSGFKWVVPATASITGGWGYSAAAYSITGGASTGWTASTAAGTGLNWGVKSSTDKLCIQLPITTGTGNSLGASSQGRLVISGVQVAVDEDDTAKKGDVSVNVSSDQGNATDQDLVIATYVDYTVATESVSTKEVVAGWDNTELGSFRIKEGLSGSILPGRTITLTLPSGVKWNLDSGNAAADTAADWPYIEGKNAFSFESEKGNITLATLGGAPDESNISNNGRTIKLTLAGGTTYSKSSFVIKKLNVSISPDFTPGDLNVELGGTAGVTGTVKVADVLAPLTITNDGSAKITIGAQAQKAGDIILTETKKEGFSTDGPNEDIVVQLPGGASWATKPTIEVTEGDVVIDSYDIDDDLLNISIKSTSSKPSTIKISNVQVTTDRTVPAGDFKVKIAGQNSNGNILSGALTDNAGNATNLPGFGVASIASAVIGQCVTPAPGEGTSGSAAGQFKIGSNIYQVNGVSKVMDVAPYIKNDRTYVPVRYLGYALGVAEDDVVWDAATQKVTLTLGDQKVELTIGNTTITVNGEAQTMDVAPEITNDRTMLPARFVAEGLGFQVGWDQSTGTVLISK